MTPKEYLQQVERAEKEIRVIKARIDHYRDLTMGSAMSMDNTPVTHSKGSSRTEMIAIGIIDTLTRLNANLGAYTAIVNDAEKMIEQVPQENYRLILTYRYLCGMSLPKCGEQLRYKDRNSIYRAHGFALVEFGKVMRKQQVRGRRLTDAESDFMMFQDPPDVPDGWYKKEKAGD